MQIERAKRKGQWITGAVLWCLCVQFFIAEQIVRYRWTTAYSWSKNYISDLGAAYCADRPPNSGNYVCSPWHDLMNASFILQGVLIIGGATLLCTLFPEGRLRTVGLWAIYFAGVSVLGVGLAPEDIRPVLHYSSAAVHFLSGNAGMILLGITLINKIKANAGKLSVLAGITGYLGLAILVCSQSLQWGMLGTWERVTAYPFPLWLTLMGFYFLVRVLSGRV